jgi:hypothetical protein
LRNWCWKNDTICSLIFLLEGLDWELSKFRYLFGENVFAELRVRNTKQLWWRTVRGGPPRANQPLVGKLTAKKVWIFSLVRPEIFLLIIINLSNPKKNRNEKNQHIHPLFPLSNLSLINSTHKLSLSLSLSPPFPPRK